MNLIYVLMKCTVEFCYNRLNFFDRCARSPRSFYFNSAIVGFSFLKISICSGVSLSG